MTSGQAIINLASQFLGQPYIWGSADPSQGGFDCSGLVQYVYGQLGIQLPRVSSQQYSVGVPIDLSQAQPGDLVFYNPGDSGAPAGLPGHVAIYIGGGKVLVASNPSVPIRISNVGDEGDIEGVRHIPAVVNMTTDASGKQVPISYTALSPYGSTSNTQASIDPTTMAEQYGFSYAFMQSDPELKGLFDQAVAGNWTPEKFTAELQNTQFFQTNSDTARKTLAQMKIDPATYNQQVTQKKATIQAQAASLGSMVSDASAQKFAEMSIMFGWNDDYTNRILGDYVQADASGHFGGTAGKIEMGLRQLANNNGISIDDGTMLNFVKNVVKGLSSVEDAQGWVLQQASLKYPAYADQINKGVNLSDLAAPYTQSLQKILELGPDAATLQDPTINSALTWKDANGQPGVMPVWQFQNNLRTDPRWKGTQNAQDSLMAAGHSVLKDFGMQN